MARPETYKLTVDFDDDYSIELVFEPHLVEDEQAIQTMSDGEFLKLITRSCTILEKEGNRLVDVAKLRVFESASLCATYADFLERKVKRPSK